jgi:hypothetical protein
VAQISPYALVSGAEFDHHNDAIMPMFVPSMDPAALRLKHLSQPGLDALAWCVVGTHDGDVWTLGRALLRECQGVR